MEHKDIKARYEAEYPDNISRLLVVEPSDLPIAKRQAAIKAATYEREMHTLKFAEWASEYAVFVSESGMWDYGTNDDTYTTAQLFQIFLKDNK